MQAGFAPAPGSDKLFEAYHSPAKPEFALLSLRGKDDVRKAFDLTLFDRLALRAAGMLAERKMDPKSAPCQASLRLGLPVDFLYRRPAEQRRLLDQLALAGEQAPLENAALTTRS